MAIERSFELGGAMHLSIGLFPTMVAMCGSLDAIGQTDRAGELRAQLIDNASQFVWEG